MQEVTAEVGNQRNIRRERVQRRSCMHAHDTLEKAIDVGSVMVIELALLSTLLSKGLLCKSEMR